MMHACEDSGEAISSLVCTCLYTRMLLAAASHWTMLISMLQLLCETSSTDLPNSLDFDRFPRYENHARSDLELRLFLQRLFWLPTNADGYWVFEAYKVSGCKAST